MFLLLFTGKRDHYKLVHCYFVKFIRDQVIDYFELSRKKWRQLKFSLGVIMFTFLRERGKLMSINVISLLYTTCLRRLFGYVKPWLFAFCNNSCGGWMRRVMVEGWVDKEMSM